MTDMWTLLFHVGKRGECAPWRLVWSSSESERDVLLHLFRHREGELTFIAVWVEQILLQMGAVFLSYFVMGIILLVWSSSYYFLHWAIVWIRIFNLEITCWWLSFLQWFQEFNKHDKEPAKYIKQWRGIKPKTGAPYSCDIGYERFLGPEVWSILSLTLSSIPTPQFILLNEQ